MNRCVSNLSFDYLPSLLVVKVPRPLSSTKLSGMGAHFDGFNASKRIWGGRLQKAICVPVLNV